MTSSSLPQTMMTLLQASRQSTQVILTESALPIPSHPEDVLVRVRATCPCAGELQWAILFPEAIPADKVMVPCQDMAGTVVQAPPSSTFATGDRVFCRISAARAGAGAEFALPRTSELAKVPAGLDWIEAAATPLSALTAWQALFVHGSLDVAGIRGDAQARGRNAEKRVLVTAGAGGVGSWALQLAALAGVKHVATVCGPDKEGIVRQLGATEVVNYRQTSIEEWVAADSSGRQFDLLVDMVGGKTLTGCWSTLREGGLLVSVAGPPELELSKPAGLKKDVAGIFFIVDPLGSNLAEIAALIDEGKVRPLIDSVWTLDEFEKAFEKLESGHATGKVVITLTGEA